MKKFKVKKQFKNILGIVLGCVLLFGAIFGLVALLNKEEKTTSISSSVFEIGGLNASGKYKETTESIYTKDMIECVGLDIKADFDSMVTFKVYFYDVNGDYLSSTSSLDSEFNSAPMIARYCRIVITPKEDTEVKWYEVSKYAKQIKITVDAKQEFPYITENDIYSLYGVNSAWDETCTMQVESTGKFATNRMNVADWSRLPVNPLFRMNVADKTKVVLILPNDAILGLTGFFANGNVVLGQATFSIAESINGITVYTVEIPANATTLGLTGNGAYANEIQVYAI